MVAVRKWARRHEKSMKRAATWTGLSVALGAFLFEYGLSNVSGHLNIVRQMAPLAAWRYVVTHSGSEENARLELFAPLLITLPLAMAFRELLRPDLASGNYATNFLGRMVTLSAGLTLLTYIVVSMAAVIGNYPIGQSLLTGFPHQTFYRLFVHNGQVNWWYVACMAGSFSFQGCVDFRETA